MMKEKSSAQYSEPDRDLDSGSCREIEITLKRFNLSMLILTRTARKIAIIIFVLLRGEGGGGELDGVYYTFSQIKI